MGQLIEPTEAPDPALQKYWNGQKTNGGTDAGFAGRSGKAAVLEGLGLAGWGYHARNEYIEIDSIPPRLYLASRMLIELGKRAHAPSR